MAGYKNDTDVIIIVSKPMIHCQSPPLLDSTTACHCVFDYHRQPLHKPVYSALTTSPKTETKAAKTMAEDLSNQLAQLSPEQRNAIMVQAQQEANQTM